jgi:non-ribosomal peptide synthetase component F
LIQGTLGILISHYFQSRDVTFGVTTAGRPAEIQGVMTTLGLFINILPLCIHFNPRQSLGDWLEQIQQKGVEIQQHGYASLSQMQSWSGVSHPNLLLDTLLVIENYPVLSSQDGQRGIKISNIRSFEQPSLPLTIVIHPGQQLEIRFLFDPGRFDRSFIQQIMGHFRGILEILVTLPEHNLVHPMAMIQDQFAVVFGNDVEPGLPLKIQPQQH